MASFEVSLPIPDRLSLPTKSLASSNRGHQALESIHSHVRHFKQQAQNFFARASSCSVRPLLGMAGGTIIKRRLIML